MISKYYPEFVTVTGLNWIPVLAAKEHKDIVLESFSFLVKDGRAKISGFVLMDTHFHWQVMGEHKRENVQRDFLRFIAQQILKKLRNSNSPLLNELIDRGVAGSFRLVVKALKYKSYEKVGHHCNKNCSGNSCLELLNPYKITRPL